MPRYEYTCNQGHVTDIVHPVGEIISIRCGECGGELRRKFSRPAIKIMPGLSPQMAQHIDRANEKREQNEAKYGRD